MTRSKSVMMVLSKLMGGAMSWSFTFSLIEFNNVNEFLWVNISYERLVIVFVMDTVIG